MLTITKAVEKFEKENPGRKVIHAGHYKDGYLLVAPGKEMEFSDSTNPVYFIDRNSGKIIRKSPTEDLQGIGKALSPDNRVF